MKTPLFILSSALVLVGCSRSDTDYSTSSSGTTPQSSPSDRYRTSAPTNQTAAGGTAATRSGTETDTASSTRSSTTAGTPAAQPGTAITPPAIPPADPTGLAKTAQDAVTQRIREAVNADTTLSTGVNDLQITMAEGKITLRGSVPSEEAKKNIEAKAKQVAGATQVDNQLTVKSAQ